jgi:putative tricarboxylic transport membrane protein
LPPAWAYAAPRWSSPDSARALLGCDFRNGWIGFYILAADKLGFFFSGIIIVALWVRVLGASWRVTTLTAVIAPLIIHLAFYKGLRVPLPWGLLERWAF